MSRTSRLTMVEQGFHISIRQQCELLGINRSGYYYRPIINNDSLLANEIMEVYSLSDCRYGYRKITKSLQSKDMKINYKKTLRLMKEMGIEGLYPKKGVNTTIRTLSHAIYPYLLEGLEICYPNQVWATDITYIKIQDRFFYFLAIIDLFSRYIVAYELSNSLNADFCVRTLQRALLLSNPEIFNSDQGCQFTSTEFISPLKAANIKISMDHKGRCFDNIFVERLWRTLKQECIYHYRPDSIQELEKRLDEFVHWYNNERIHQSLAYKTPSEFYNLEEIRKKSLINIQ